MNKKNLIQLTAQNRALTFEESSSIFTCFKVVESTMEKNYTSLCGDNNRHNAASGLKYRNALYPNLHAYLVLAHAAVSQLKITRQSEPQQTLEVWAPFLICCVVSLDRFPPFMIVTEQI